MSPASAVVAVFLLLSASFLVPRAAEAQEPSAPRFHVDAQGAVSMTYGARGPRFGTDLVSYGLRMTGPGWRGVRPWAETAAFRRPDLRCVAGFPCTTDGWLLRGGAALPLSDDQAEPGLNGALLGGAGAAFGEDTALTYFVGLNLYWRQLPRLSPTAELRWEQIGGITLGMIAVGIRLDL